MQFDDWTRENGGREKFTRSMNVNFLYIDRRNRSFLTFFFFFHNIVYRAHIIRRVQHTNMYFFFFSFHVKTIYYRLLSSNGPTFKTRRVLIR